MTTATEIDTVPPLVAGDRLTRAEFRRRYEAMPPGVFAELIDGVVYMASPVSYQFHGLPHNALQKAFQTYEVLTPGTRSAFNNTVELDDANEPQPDGCMFILPGLGGQAWFDNGYIAGTPELVAEVANTTARLDLNQKRAMYERCGAVEYVVLHVPRQTLLWFALGDAGYEPVPADPDGLVRSRVFPGLWLNPTALFGYDLLAVDAAVTAGCRTPAYAAFVARLAAARTTGSQPS